MKSDGKANDQKSTEEGKEKPLKKLKSKFTPSSSSQSEIKDIANLAFPSISSNSSPVERQTPEGDDNFILTKSASETNLQETWKSVEILTKDNKKSSTKSAVTVECNQFYLSSEQKRFARTHEIFGEFKRYACLWGAYIGPASFHGDLGTGKTSIIKRYVHRFFTQHYRATIGVDFALKVLNWDDNTLIRLQLWDIAGQERYGNMTRVYYKEAVGAFIVFDVTRRNTFESVANWKSDLDSKVQLSDGSPIPCVLLANKCDQLKENALNNKHMVEYCQENGFTAWFETSARDNINIDEAARALVEKILEQDALLNNDSKRDQFSLTRDSNDQKKWKKILCLLTVL
ncbi:hypothetical protein NQ314_001481 [Rhamnusium bicolor]|uniref:Ras-related protein Rab n=1 Tax=Rhamnusium bicolor TaxID=1586634 RepID=A0AAV8ZUD3_9CUCU|nr:hypothetical protein NQ314_001481 [Rhamnusium bicolor]